MKYSNPELPEGINTTRENPLKDLVVLTGGLIISVVAIIWILVVIIGNFADNIPFRFEKNLPVSDIFEDKNLVSLSPYLKNVSNRVIASFNLPEEMKITVHYVNDDTVNAFATLGGHIVLFRGLVEKLKYEDELAMVIAHEVAHIKHRHPILSASHGIVVGIVLSVISSSAGESVASDLMESAGLATVLKFSRDFEYESDKDAIQSLVKLYGHADGALGLFKVFKSEFGKGGMLEFLATHPLTENRIEQTNKIITQYKVSGKHSMRPYPTEFKAWLKSQNKNQQKK
jgi:predicted Zn-dependent protease